MSYRLIGITTTLALVGGSLAPFSTCGIHRRIARRKKRKPRTREVVPPRFAEKAVPR